MEEVLTGDFGGSWGHFIKICGKACELLWKLLGAGWRLRGTQQALFRACFNQYKYRHSKWQAKLAHETSQPGRNRFPCDMLVTLGALGVLWGLWGALWGHLGGHFGRSWGHFWASRGHFGVSQGHFGNPWQYYGALGGASGYYERY